MVVHGPDESGRESNCGEEMSKQRTPKEWALWRDFILALGKNWARKNTKSVRREYARFWSTLDPQERALARFCGWHRPEWIAEERARGRKIGRVERRRIAQRGLARFLRKVKV